MDTGSSSTYLSKYFANDNNMLIDTSNALNVTGLHGTSQITLGSVAPCTIVLGDVARWNNLTL